ncbi:MAG: hypothetical protein RLZZ574_2595 [Cyanobacteriota bacterium]
MGNGFYPTEIRCNFGQWRLSVLITGLSIIFWQPVLSHQTETVPIATQSVENSTPKNLTPKNFTCPNNLPELTALLLQDLPAYSNRVIQRTQNLNQAAGTENYIVTANKAEFEPLTLPRLQYDQIGQDPEQIFFTVLERQYIEGKIVEIQTYHWLFLTQTASGWRTVMLFSRFGNSLQDIQDSPPAPPRETTNGIIGRGVQLWFRDCRANAIRSSL